MKTHSERMHYIDSLRGIAALSVVVYHFALYAQSRAINQPAVETFIIKVLCEWLDLGKFGVVLFFLISGFVIPNSLKPGNDQIIPFVISRFFRLYPLYWLVLFLGLFTTDEIFSGMTILANTTMIQNFLGYQNVVGAFWTLQIELVFYTLCVLLSILGILTSVRARMYSCFAFLTIAILMSIARYITLHKFPIAIPLSLTMMFLGSLLRANLDGQNESRQAVKIVIILFGISLVPIAYLGYHMPEEHWLSYVACYSLALIMFLLCTNRFRINWMPLAFCGEISYSIYLIHSLVGGVINHLGSLSIGLIAIDSSLYVLVVTALTMVVSVFTFHYIEKPFNAVGKRIKSWNEVRAHRLRAEV